MGDTALNKEDIECRLGQSETPWGERVRLGGKQKEGKTDGRWSIGEVQEQQPGKEDIKEPYGNLLSCNLNKKYKRGNIFLKERNKQNGSLLNQ